MTKYFWKYLILIILVAGIGPVATQAANSPVQVFQEVLFLIENYHIEDPTMGKIMDGAIKGMVETLDPFSEYLSPEEYQEMQVEFEGHFGGIGIVITPDLTIVSPIKGTPGERAGLKPGDQIIAINGEPSGEMTQKQAINIMRGEPGTSVVITIKRETEEKPFEVHIIRDQIEIPYVEWEMKNDRVGYIFIAQFVQNVGAKVEQALTELSADGAEGIILDLRNNPGGLLDEAISVASNFISKGMVVAVKQKSGKDSTYNVLTSIKSTRLPLVVLINQGSASASEIVAGAIQDYHRGKLIGMKTFGKGTVQSVIPLSDGSALRLTTAKYYTPSDRFIHEMGIEPDIEIEYDPDYEGDNQLERAIEHLKSARQAESSPDLNLQSAS